MKKKILLASAGLVAIAISVGIPTALFCHNPELAVRLSTVGYILVTGSMGQFFVGLAYPKEA